MQPEIYHALAKAGTQYWWNQGRQHLVLQLLKKYCPAGWQPGTLLRILDIGCAAGGTLTTLAKIGEAWGLDIAPEAIELCAQWGIARDHLILGNAEKMTAFENQSFDVITAVEILEHLSAPQRGLKEIYRVLKPEGVLILTVPADQKLWSDRDLRLGHFHRYTVAELKQAVQAAGFQVLKASYANAFYYWPYRLLLASQRWWSKGAQVPRIKKDTFETQLFLSGLFTLVLKFETAIILRGGLPWGVSAVCVVKKPQPGVRP